MCQSEAWMVHYSVALNTGAATARRPATPEGIPETERVAETATAHFTLALGATATTTDTDATAGAIAATAVGYFTYYCCCTI
jgi:hypothetical protein